MGITDLVQDAAKTVELDQNRVGRLSRMDAMQGQAMAMASADRQSHQLKLIAAALQRIDDGDYGQCLECDEAIPSARLEADPVTEFCINCAAQRERRDG
ncbi:MAG: TraR/DksA family transcriptional regulator [Gammaproteobacteria bacterium]|nr:TraR/DksA family transcriptional regulator [Gammaproteobacteria bacterium]